MFQKELTVYYLIMPFSHFIIKFIQILELWLLC